MCRVPGPGIESATKTNDVFHALVLARGIGPISRIYAERVLREVRHKPTTSWSSARPTVVRTPADR